MRKSNMLTIEDLVSLCESGSLRQFNSKNYGKELRVQVPCEYFEIEDTKDELTLFANVKLMHTGYNRNRSNLTEKGAKSCLSKMAYKPILADFTEINGERDFTSHAIEFNDDGTRTYIERQVGCFTADKAYMKQDSEREDRKYIYARVAIPREYTDAADIIERKGGTKISAELAINEMSYSVDDGLLLEDVEVMGCTLLGVDPSSGEPIMEGMEGAYLQIEDFCAENNSVINKQNLINEITNAVLRQLESNKNNQANFAEENTAERRKTKVDNENANVEFNEAETNEDEVKVTENEEVNVNAETTKEDETPVADMEESEENKESDDTDSPDVVEDTVEEFDDDPVEDDSDDDEVDNTDDGVLNNGQQKTYTVNGMTFEVSMSEVINSLWELVNNSYSESDNDYYSVEVYESSKTVVMIGWFTGRAYRQSYKVRNDVYSLVGDRIPVKAVYVTADEEAELDKIRSNYSAISDKLAKYEAEPEKMEILNSSDYSNIADQVDFVELKKRENHFDLTVEELKNKADAMLLQYAKSGKLNFAATEPEKKDVPKRDFFAFAAREEKSSFLDGLLKRR